MLLVPLKGPCTKGVAANITALVFGILIERDTVDLLPGVKLEALVRLVKLNGIRQLACLHDGGRQRRLSYLALVALDEKGMGGGWGRKKSLEARNCV